MVPGTEPAWSSLEIATGTGEGASGSLSWGICYYSDVTNNILGISESCSRRGWDDGVIGGRVHSPEVTTSRETPAGIRLPVLEQPASSHPVYVNGD